MSQDWTPDVAPPQPAPMPAPPAPLQPQPLPQTDRAPVPAAPGGAVSTPAREGEVQAPRAKRRRLVLPIAILLALGAGAYYANGYLSAGRFLVSTDDAYVGADMAVIAARVSGYVAAVPVVDNVRVKAGDVLVRIDDKDLKLAVEAAQARLDAQDATIARVGKQLAAQSAAIDQANAQVPAAQGQVAAAQANALNARQAYDRAASLLKSGAGTKATLDAATAARDSAEAALKGAQAGLVAAQAGVAGATSARDVLAAQVKEAQAARAELVAALDQANVNLSYATVRAPFDGVVGNRAAQPGQFVAPGARLMALVPDNGFYVSANFKETQLAGMKPGQKVDVSIDAAGGKTYVGTVESIAPASGSLYSLLPPDNATGNFTKIVQRVAARIALPAAAETSGALRDGLSVVVDVHTRDPNAPR
ncbi:MAG: HlyD family secretion protein, partial [Hyphomicrobiales bacterium]|nr:HlyD family secretion protein [Hyphomicrobiales bacterium]